MTLTLELDKNKELDKDKKIDKALKAAQSTDPNKWPDLILYQSVL